MKTIEASQDKRAVFIFALHVLSCTVLLEVQWNKFICVKDKTCVDKGES